MLYRLAATIQIVLVLSILIFAEDTFLKVLNPCNLNIYHSLISNYHASPVERPPVNLRGASGAVQ